MPAKKPAIKATPTSSAKPKVTNAIITKGEAEFIKELQKGTPFGQARKKIMDKYGFSPNGYTN